MIKCSLTTFVNLLVCKLRPILITKTEKKQSHGSEQNIISPPTPNPLKWPLLKCILLFINNLQLTRLGISSGRHDDHDDGKSAG